MIDIASLRPRRRYLEPRGFETRDDRLRRPDPVETLWAVAGFALLVAAYSMFAPGPLGSRTPDLTSTLSRTVAAAPVPTPGPTAHPPGARPSAGLMARP
ncbi:MAG: hypothetical protein HY060_10860 [Proteobacteria bacterium]|nr:hypothetical protein [Pseudomonadota bacterium]